MDVDLDYYKYKKYKALYKNSGGMSKVLKSRSKEFPTHFKNPGKKAWVGQSGEKILINPDAIVKGKTRIKYGLQPGEIVGRSKSRWTGRKKWDEKYNKPYINAPVPKKQYPSPLYLVKFNLYDFSSELCFDAIEKRCPTLTIEGEEPERNIIICIYPEDRIIHDKDKYEKRMKEIQNMDRPGIAHIKAAQDHLRAVRAASKKEKERRANLTEKERKKEDKEKKKC